MEMAIGFLIFSAITLTGILVPTGNRASNLSSLDSDKKVLLSEEANNLGESVTTGKIGEVKPSLFAGIEMTKKEVTVGEIPVENFDGDDRSIFQLPVKEIKVRSPFGNRIHPISKKKKFHKGIDLDGEKGDPILASADGVVVFAGNKNGYGRVVEINHGENWLSVYAHLDEIKVRKQQKVKVRELIGTMGKSGQATGVHLHFELRKNGKVVDPADEIDFY